MAERWKYAFLFSLLTLQPWCVSGQMEKITTAELTGCLKKLPILRQNTKNPFLADRLKNVSAGKDTKKDIVNAVRVAEDLKKHPSFTGEIPHYAVPPMSELQRLPDAYPLDGGILAPVRIVSARGEYEPGSFVVYPLAGHGKVEFKLGNFKTADGKIFPQDKLDLKLVKVWYQNGNGWYSYFGDTGLKLVPELLLNDEDLIRVDTKGKQNFARLTEKNGAVSYTWITPPVEIDKRPGWPGYCDFTPFQPMRENFQDAGKLCPVTLEAGAFKQFFLTAHVTKDQPPGLYRGSVRMVRNGAGIGNIPVLLKVLPFDLPEPEAYVGPKKPFLVSSYSYISLWHIMVENGGNLELAKKQMLATFADQAIHGQTMHMNRSSCFDYEGRFTLETMKRAGMRTDYLMGGSPTGYRKWQKAFYAKLYRKYYLEHFGHTNVFLAYGDEPGANWVMNSRNLFETYQKEGLKFFIAGGNQVFHKGGYFYDFFNMAHSPEDRDSVQPWNEVGHAWTAWYAVQHVGTENPAFNRRQNGLAPYLSGYSALCNYAHHYGPYNDRRMTYKPMVFAYGTGSGVIDTLQWEGFREGIDDIRYATLLKHLAQKASASQDLNIQYAGRIALQFFAELDSASCDLNETRLEMIRHILVLRKLLKKTGGTEG